MRLHSVRIENFRSFRDQSIKLDEYTSLVGPNGAGKSAVLTALAVFFRDTKNSATDVLNLAAEDFHHRDTSRPVKITLTFDQLSGTAQEDLKHYFRHGLLVVSAKAEWDSESESAEVKQFGSRLVMQALAPFFEAIDGGERVPQLREKYQRIREQFPELPDERTKNGMEQALREYEEARPDDCELLDDTAQFYGWSRGENLLSKHLQWVYIPAVKDASTEQEESSKTALGQLLERTVRSRVNFKEPIAELRDKLEADYRELIDKERATLTELESSIKTRLRRWANPAADLALNWHYDRSKSLTVAEPVARVSIGEDDFLGEVTRLGHGMQRSFLLAVLQELASSDQDTGPTLLLGFEEPELYQHPPPGPAHCFRVAAVGCDD